MSNAEKKNKRSVPKQQQGSQNNTQKFCFRIGDHYGAASFVQILAPELTDRMLADLLDLDAPVTVTLHIKSIDQSEAIKTVKRKLSDLDAMKIAEQKKAVRAGYDMDVLPADLVTYATLKRL
jgi:hypothetical protein